MQNFYMKKKNKIKKRTVCVITGTRAEYGLLRPVMKAIRREKNLSLRVIATGMHLSHAFGYTINEIKRDGFSVDSKIDILSEKNTPESVVASIGKCVIGMAKSLKKIKPDIVLILGDRFEILASAVAAAYMNIPIAHLHGGDSAKAGLDEYARHAITKLSNIHFPATKKSAERIKKMGENPQNIFTVGAPGLDEIIHGTYTQKNELIKKYNLKTSEPILLVAQHPVTTEFHFAGKQMKETMEAIRQMNLQTVLIYPNSDAGGKDIISVIKKYKYLKSLKTYKNVPREDYLGLLRISNALIGNSSSGIIEAPSFHLPVVNIGIRQEGRESSTNIINVQPRKKEILRAIKKALYDKKFIAKVQNSKNPYGNGTAGIKIANILSKIIINKKLIEKKITY